MTALKSDLRPQHLPNRPVSGRRRKISDYSDTRAITPQRLSFRLRRGFKWADGKMVAIPMVNADFFRYFHLERGATAPSVHLLQLRRAWPTSKAGKWTLEFFQTDDPSKTITLSVEAPNPPIEPPDYPAAQ